MLWYSLTPSLDLGNQSPVDLVIHILLILLASLLRDLLPAFWIRSIVLPRPIVRDAPECIVTMLGTVLDERFDLLIGDHDGFRDVRSVGDLVENGGGEEHLVQFSNCAEFRLGDGDARDAKGRPLVVCICHNFLAMHALDLDCGSFFPAGFIAVFTVCLATCGVLLLLRRMRVTVRTWYRLLEI